MRRPARHSAPFLEPPTSGTMTAVSTQTEQALSKIKAFLRTAKERTREALEQAIQQTLSAITASDAYAWFTSCGYTVP